MDKVRRSANKETKGAPPNFFTVMSAKHASLLKHLVILYRTVSTVRDKEFENNPGTSHDNLVTFND